MLDRRLMKLSLASLLRALVAAGLVATLLLAQPATIAEVVAIAGAYVFTDGMVLGWSSVARVGADGGWLPLFVAALVAMLCGGGVVSFAPGTERSLSLLAVWAITAGLLEALAELRVRRAVKHDALLLWAGILGAALGLSLLRAPRTVAVAGELFIAYGGAMALVHTALALRLRRAARGRAGTPGVVA